VSGLSNVDVPVLSTSPRSETLLLLQGRPRGGVLLRALLQVVAGGSY
jgi:hypothetical protein